MSNAFVDKNLYKIFLIIIKFIPNILAVIKMCSLILNYCKITTFTLTCLGGTSIITLLVLYLISYVFKFCGIHRISLHYVSLIYVITVIDYYIGIPIVDAGMVTLQLALFFIAIVVALITHLKQKKHDT